jgi:hypothetical protein
MRQRDACSRQEHAVVRLQGTMPAAGLTASGGRLWTTLAHRATSNGQPQSSPVHEGGKGLVVRPAAPRSGLQIGESRSCGALLSRPVRRSRLAAVMGGQFL